MTLTRLVRGALCAAVMGALAAGASAQTRGVTKDEIVLGFIVDLSGPIAYGGKQARQGMQMRIDEINAAGGIHGRKLRLIAEDNGYDVKRTVLITQKFVNNDNVFAALYTFGSAHAVAAMPILYEKNVVNFMPGTGSRLMFEPPQRLGFAGIQPAYDLTVAGVRHLVKQKPNAKVCTVYQDDETGLEFLRGTETALKALNMPMTTTASYKRGTTDFSSQVARLKSAGCTLVVNGSLVPQSVGIVNEARKLDFNPDFLVGEIAYSNQLLELGAKAVEGMYAVHGLEMPSPDASEKRARDWYARYVAKFGDTPGSLNPLYAYLSVDLFAQAAQKAGPNLTPDAFVAAMEANRFPSPLGGPEFAVTKTNRLGFRQATMSQLRNGKWVVVANGLKQD
ncbi:ABC transporter substrate-binding protein [Ramlibacter sp.]|uniref:ABC transporter substrate-binding protein n=1 Tax=Ramlibacter sp. TaxID=1917967 RepID=UPI003D13A7C6